MAKNADIRFSDRVLLKCNVQPFHGPQDNGLLYTAGISPVRGVMDRRWFISGLPLPRRLQASRRTTPGHRPQESRFEANIRARAVTL
jgi:hypothetical protein